MDLTQLAKCCDISAETAGKWLQPINDAMSVFGIDTPARRAMFLAQTGHETTGFSRTVENLNYSAEGLATTWRSRFATTDGKPNAVALQLSRNPEAIANSVYAGRNGNGDPASGDGWRYRGRGLIQVTGRDNYRACGQDLGINLIDHPEWLEIPKYAAASAGWFWRKHDLNASADIADILGATKKINGGPNGLPDRKRRWDRARYVMGIS